MIDLLKICFSPNKVYESLKGNLRIHLPLVTLILNIVIVCVVAYFFVFVGDIVSSEEALREAFEEFVGKGTSTSLLFNFLIAFVLSVLTVFGSMVGVVLLATFFLLAGKVLQQPFRWIQWFGFTLWSLMPSVLCSLVQLVCAIFVGFGEATLSPLNWIPSLRENWIASLIDIQVIWTAVIMTFGLRRWTDKSLAICITVVCILMVVPFALGVAFDWWTFRDIALGSTP